MKSDWWPNEALAREEMAIVDAEDEIIKTASRQVSEEAQHVKQSAKRERPSSESRNADSRGSPNILSNKYDMEKRLIDTAHIQQILEKIKKVDQIEDQNQQNWDGTELDRKNS